MLSKLYKCKVKQKELNMASTIISKQKFSSEMRTSIHQILKVHQSNNINSTNRVRAPRNQPAPLAKANIQVQLDNLPEKHTTRDANNKPRAKGIHIFAGARSIISSKMMNWFNTRIHLSLADC